MKFTRQQEVALIEIGLNTLLRNTLGPKPKRVAKDETEKPRKKRRKMSAAARKAISLRMKKVWAEKNKSK